ncbi:MAG: exodeoxyribonuclease III [Pyrinomonadaceae bacterium]
MLVATWNVNSIAVRLPHVLQWLETARPDVLCLQEIKCADEKFPAAAFAEIGYTSQSFGQRTYNGVAILARDEISNVHRGFSGIGQESQSRLLAATVAGVRVVDVYVPNGQSVGSEKFDYKMTWLKRLRAFFDANYKTNELVLLCGDFNIAPEDRDVHDPNAWRGKILFSAQEHAALAKLQAWGFVDAFRRHIEEGGHYTWWDYRAASFRRNDGLRIDHIWVSPALAKLSTRTWIDTAPRAWERPSDHCPVIAEFKIDF